MVPIPAFSAELKRLTQMSYMLASGATLLSELDPRTIANTLQWRVESLCTDGRSVRRIALSPPTVQENRDALPSFISDLLLVYLEALAHFRLAFRAGYEKHDRAPSLERLIATLMGSAPISEWWYKDVILLSEIRNCVLHADGEVAVPNARLRKAGWDTADLEQEGTLTQRAFSDFLRFKRSVRTAANRLAL